MSIKTKIATVAIAALAATSLSVTQASAKKFPVGPVLLGAAVVGTAIAASSQPGYPHHMHHKHCWLQPQQNMFGQVYYVKVCQWN